MSGGRTAYAATVNPVFSDKGDSRGFVLTFSPQKKYHFATNPSGEISSISGSRTSSAKAKPYGIA